MDTFKKHTNIQLTEKSQRVITRRANGSIRVQTQNLDPSETDQSVAQDQDINTIMQKFEKHGIRPYGSTKKGVYDDVSQLPKSLTEASIIIKDSEERFSSLPSQVREKFHNNPQAMISFLENPKNYEEAVQLGLLTKKLNEQTQTNEQKNQKSPKNKTDPQKNSDDSVVE